jgi:TRAP transporter 4TM/12TM fusion protein
MEAPIVFQEETPPTMFEEFLGERPIHTLVTFLTVTLSVALSLYHMYVSYVGTPEAHAFRSTHLAFILSITFLVYPLGRSSWKDPYKWYSAIDFLLVAAVVAIQIYTLYDIDALILRAGSLTDWDIRVGTAMIFILLEATRRAVGWAMVIIAGFFLAHAVFSDHFFWIFFGPPNDWFNIIDYLFIRDDGIYGIPLMVMATYIYLFILFGSLLMVSGAGRFFINVAMALTGATRGGPAKAAVVSSSLMATISGSCVANVVTTGTFTIPLMKRVGYRPVFAGAVESCASTGGMIMPPVMGAAAFIIAEFLSVPYLEVCIAAFTPSVLYFFTLFFMVHFEAVKHDLPVLKKEELPDLKTELKRGAHLFISLIVIIGLLVLGYTPMFAAFWAIISVIALSFVRKETRITPIKLMSALENGAVKAIPVSVACAAAGIIIGSVFVSGLGLKFTNLIIEIASGRLWLGLILTMLASLILGMGLTATAVYITVAALVIPAIVNMGVAPMAAHLFAFYFGIVSAITPPVCLAAFAAAGISGSNPMVTGFTSFRLGIATYILPFVFVYAPGLVFVGPWYEIVRCIAATTLGMFVLTVVTERWLYSHINWLATILLLITSALLLVPGITYNGIGLIAFVCMVAMLRLKRPQPAVST